MAFLRTALALVSLAPLLAHGGEVIRTVDDYRAYVVCTNDDAKAFDLRGTVTYVASAEQFVLDDGAGRVYVRTAHGETVSAGDRVRVSGTVTHRIPNITARRAFWRSLFADKVEITGKTSVPETVDSTVGAIVRGEHYLQRVRVIGTVDDLLPDDVDPGYSILILREGAQTLLVSLRHPNALTASGRDIVGARVSITGLCVYGHGGVRQLTGWRLMPKQADKLTILSPPDANAARNRPLEPLAKIGPEVAIALGRRMAIGRVLAAWEGNQLLLDAGSNMLVRVELADGERLPPCGTVIRATGTVETDLFRLNLSRARICVLDPVTNAAPSTDPVLSPSDIYVRQGEQTAFNAAIFGKPMSAEGTVRTLPLPGTHHARLTLDCDGMELPVDVTSCPETLAKLSVGCRIRAVGVFILDTANWRPTQPFPRITGMFIAVRSFDDLTVVRAAPWWTPLRLSIAIVVLLLALVGITLWSLLLRRLAERRGRELAAETIARTESELKVFERTRLAVELHDSIAQNLTGAALEIRTAKRGPKKLESDTEQHLDIALKTIDSSRTALRNCIWDLRNRALEEDDLEAAIRLTLAPHVGGTDVAIRFPVDRAMISDTTAHAFLSIIRELTLNAIRHGGATAIKIAGAIENGRLLFSVRDNGCGFDPERCPGMEQGHFGLQGVRERAKEFKGQVRIDSRPGAGAKVTITIPLPRPDRT